ncbi:peptide deformylase [Fundidesulfovibrio butyratiphilus]
MAREILTYPNPVLAQKSEDVQEITQEIRDLADEMAQLMYENRGIGLAAPQVGESRRLVTIDLSGPEERTELMVLVNPVILSKEGKVVDEEGCLSVTNFRAKVERAEKVLVKARNLDGEEVNLDADGLLAICLQHELDHLDGVLFIDRISRLKRGMYDAKIKKWSHRKKKS